ncbi:MAG: hypothetical protein WEA61_10625 [Anaerolineales bacterium]
MQAVSQQTTPPAQAVAFENLQAAILRLHTKRDYRPTGAERHELRAMVDRALEAYREYMRVENTK